MKLRRQNYKREICDNTYPSHAIFGVSRGGKAYISGFGEGIIVSDSDLTSSAVPGVVVQAEFDTGFNAGGALGYDWGTIRGNLRLDTDKTTLTII